ncbi:MAG: hypothetical protein IJV51_04460 [Oscillospiraceae bacterium]|jgi:hypothetical protein|nr:hypothetical protein [Oscillospiraceae bacterium]
MNTFDFDLDLFIKSFTDAGAVITKESGKIVVDGKETDLVSAIKRGLNDFGGEKAARKELKHATVSYNPGAYGSSDQLRNWPSYEQIILAA